MSLRLQINLLLTIIISLLAFALLWQQVSATRASVHEEIEAAERVATRVLARVSQTNRSSGSAGMLTFLGDLGRLRAIDIKLIDAENHELYASPKSTYKAGNEAPQWFARHVSPARKASVFSLINGQLLVQTDPSRAALDGWDDFKRLLWALGIGFVLLNLLAYWLVGNATRPFSQIMSALHKVKGGDYDIRLPALGGTEANAIGQAFNGMAQSVKESIEVREQAASAAAELAVNRDKATRATQELAQNRELSQEYQQRVEHDHGELARELHDELGQHVTAIKSMGVSISRRVTDSDPAIAQASTLIVESADRIHLAMRGILSRLKPVSLDQFGLADAISDMVSDLRLQHPDKKFTVRIGPGLDVIAGQISTTAFRIVQESLTNAIRHAGASTIDVNLRMLNDALVLQVEDNGIGMPPLSAQTQGFGLNGMRERTTVIGGQLDVGKSRMGGVVVRATLPLTQQHTPPHAAAG